MATYGTDLVVLATGSDADGSGTWLELASPYNSGGTPAQDGENFIQGSDCVSQSLSASKTGAVFSIVFDAGSDISGSIPSGDVVCAWVYFAVGSNLDTRAAGGHQFVIGVDTSNLESWYISGNDRSPNPYGGWWNVAVDPLATASATIGTGSGGAWQFFGTIVDILNTISKGTPHAVDAQRMGRGEIFAHGTAGTLTLLAASNDAVSARWGLFQDLGGGAFLWKGLMSLGITATALTLTASNQNIKVDDAEHTYLAFNKIEFNHVDTDVTWTNIVFSAAGTLSPGQLEMIADCTFVMTGGGFNNMDTFIFLTGATLTAVLFNGCNQVTHGGSVFSGCKFEGYEGTVATAYLVYNAAVDPNGELDGCEFTMGTALTHAIEFTSAAPLTMTIPNLVTSGYQATQGGGDGPNDATFLFADRGSDQTWTLNLENPTGNTTYRKARTGDTIVIQTTVTLTVTVQDEAGDAVVGARVAIYDSSGTELMNEDTIAGGIASASYNYGGDEVISIRTRESLNAASGRYFPDYRTGLIEGTGFSVTVGLTGDGIASVV